MPIARSLGLALMLMLGLAPSACSGGGEDDDVCEEVWEAEQRCGGEKRLASKRDFYALCRAKQADARGAAELAATAACARLTSCSAYQACEDAHEARRRDSRAPSP